MARQRSAVRSQKSVAAVVAAGLQAEEKAAVGIAVSGQQSAVSVDTAQITAEARTAWERANKLGTAAEKQMMKTGLACVAAGAAFHLAKLQTGHGNWEATVAANSKFSDLTIQLWMQTAEHALLTLGYDRDERAFTVFVENASKSAKAHRGAVLKTDCARHLLSDLKAACEGKSGRQLQMAFGIRKPKAKTLPAHDDDPHDASKRAERAAAEYVWQVSQLLKAVAGHVQNFDGTMLHDFVTACEGAITTVNPARRFAAGIEVSGQRSEGRGQESEVSGQSPERRWEKLRRQHAVNAKTAVTA